MRTQPDFIRFDGDHVIVRVQVSVPWRNEECCYQHAFDSPGLREEFGPLPEPRGFNEREDAFTFFRRREMQEKRAKAVEMIAHSIARSILNALDKEQTP
jgi:hypothetical protein